jgi:WD40 repeat protein
MPRNSIYQAPNFTSVTFFFEAMRHAVLGALATIDSSLDRNLAILACVSSKRYAVGGGQFIMIYMNGVTWSCFPGQENSMDRFEVIRLPRKSNFAQCLDISPDGRLLATGGAQEVAGISGMNIGVRLWDPVTLEELRSLEGFNTYSIQFSPDSRYLACSNGDHVYMWNLNGQESFTLEGNSRVEKIAFSPDGTRLAAACADATIRLWDMETRDSIVFEAHNPRMAATGGAAAFCVAFSPNGQLLATGGCDDTIRFWEPNSGRSKGLQIELSDHFHPNPVYHIAFSPDGASLVVGAEVSVELWDITSRKQMCVLLQDTLSKHPLAFSPDGQLIAAAFRGHSETDRHIKVWKTEEVRRCSLDGELRLSTANIPETSNLVFSRDSQALFSAHQSEIRRWNLEDYVRSAHQAGAHGIFCGSCGEENPTTHNFCSRCGQPLTDKASSAATFEYLDFIWEVPTDKAPDCVLAREGWPNSDPGVTLRQLTESEARVHFWQKYQREILGEFQKWQDTNWQPITEVGASCIELVRSSSQESSRILYLAKALLLEQWCLVGARIKVRRQKLRS